MSEMPISLAASRSGQFGPDTLGNPPPRVKDELGAFAGKLGNRDWFMNPELETVDGWLSFAPALLKSMDAVVAIIEYKSASENSLIVREEEKRWVRFMGLLWEVEPGAKI